MDSTHSMPVIMLTADATPEAREECINAGANAYLTKPINVKELLEKIALLSRNLRRESASNSRHKATASNLIANDYPESPWFNETVLHELSLLGDGPNFIKDLVEDFIGDGTRHIERITDAASHDYLEFREALHALKGSSVELGANKLVAICLKAEALKPYDIETDRIQTMVREITRIFKLTTEALSAAISSSSKFNPRGSE
jgi:two-component system sensor histidine kinase RpfC